MKTVLCRPISRNRLARKATNKKSKTSFQIVTRTSACSASRSPSGRTTETKHQSAPSVRSKEQTPKKDVKSATKSTTCILASSTKDVPSVLPGTGQRVSPTLCSLLAFSVRILFRRGTYIKTKAKCAVQTATLSDQS